MDTPLINEVEGASASKSSNIALELAILSARSKRPSGSGMSEISREIRMYRDSVSPDLSENIDPIAYWDAHLFARNPTYSILPGIALDVLAIPATTAPVERVFSHAGCVLGLRRLRLTDDNLERKS